MPEPAPLLFELIVVLAGSKCFGEIFERLALPAVLGEILAGIVFGPYALGIIRPSPTVYAIAQVSAVFLLFMVGLETSPKEIIKVGGKALQVAISGVFVTFVLGFGYLFLRHQPAHEAMFLATAMAATSVAITARALADLGLLQTPSATLIPTPAVLHC